MCPCHKYVNLPTSSWESRERLPHVPPAPRPVTPLSSLSLAATGCVPHGNGRHRRPLADRWTSERAGKPEAEETPVCCLERLRGAAQKSGVLPVGRRQYPVRKGASPPCQVSPLVCPEPSCVCPSSVRNRLRVLWVRVQAHFSSGATSRPDPQHRRPCKGSFGTGRAPVGGLCSPGGWSARATVTRHVPVTALHVCRQRSASVLHEHWAIPGLLRFSHEVSMSKRRDCRGARVGAAHIRAEEMDLLSHLSVRVAAPPPQTLG